MFLLSGFTLLKIGSMDQEATESRSKGYKALPHLAASFHPILPHTSRACSSTLSLCEIWSSHLKNSPVPSLTHMFLAKLFLLFN